MCHFLNTKLFISLEQDSKVVPLKNSQNNFQFDKNWSSKPPNLERGVFGAFIFGNFSFYFSLLLNFCFLEKMARLGRVGQGVFQDPVEHWKIVTIGVGGVGKSSFIFQFVDSVFVDDYDPTIEDCFRKNVCFLLCIVYFLLVLCAIHSFFEKVNVQGTVCALEILDTAG